MSARRMAAAALVLAAVWGGAARADDPVRRRAELRRAIDAALDDIAEDVDGVEAASDGAARVLRAIGKADDVKEMLRDLGEVAEGDDDAEDMVRAWPRQVDEFKEAAQELRLMRADQEVQDKAPKNCKDLADKLKTAIDGYLKTMDPAGIEALEKEGRKWGPPVAKVLEDYDKKRDALKTRKDKVKGFSFGEGGWGDVKKNLGDSAEAVLMRFNRANTEAHDACDRIAKAEKNVDIVDAIAKLKKDKAEDKNTLDRAKVDYERWLNRLRELQKWHETGEEDIRKAFCEADEDAEDEIVQGEIYNIANRVRDKLKGDWDKIESDGKDLAERLKELEKENAKDKAVSEAAKKMWTEIERRTRSIKAQLEKGVFKGSNHPMIRARIELGKKKHTEIQKSSTCTDSEITIPGKGMRLDCVKADSTCIIREIKPNSPRAMLKGKERLGEYKKGVEGYWKDKPGDFKSGDLSVFAKCIDEKGIKLKTELVTYDLCKDEINIEDVEVD